jgi:hypothetical protein
VTRAAKRCPRRHHHPSPEESPGESRVVPFDEALPEPPAPPPPHTHTQTHTHTHTHLCCFLRRLPSQVLATAQALLANGGIMAPAGTHIAAMAARRHSVPFVVLCGIYKLSTLFPHNPGDGRPQRQRRPSPKRPSSSSAACRSLPFNCTDDGTSPCCDAHTHRLPGPPTPQPLTSTTLGTPPTSCPTRTRRCGCRGRRDRKPSTGWCAGAWGCWRAGGGGEGSRAWPRRRACNLLRCN